MKKRTKNIVMALTLVAVLAVGSVCAYFTDTETAINKFTVGNVDIVLSEPSFDEAKAKDLYAGQTVAKDPTVTNDGVNSAYVYLKVRVPKANVITAKENGERNAQAVTELFTYTVHANWTLLSSDTTHADYNEYVYSYKNALAKNEATEPLFTSVTIVNLIEGQVVPGVELNVVVDAYAIQSANTGTAAEAWVKYCNQNP